MRHGLDWGAGAASQSAQYRLSVHVVCHVTATLCHHHFRRQDAVAVMRLYQEHVRLRLMSYDDLVVHYARSLVKPPVGPNSTAEGEDEEEEEEEEGGSNAA